MGKKVGSYSIHKDRFKKCRVVKFWLGYECGEDALMQESEQSYLRSFSGVAAPLRPGGYGSSRAELLSTSPPSMLASMPVYASNLDQHIDRALLTGSQNFFYILFKVV